MAAKKYLHTEEIHNLKSPSQIVPVIMKIVNPHSVVDVGCGIGTFLKSFRDYGVNDLLGIDGKWTDMELLSKYLKPEEFKEVDLEKKIDIGRQFDLAISLEVAEHLKKDAADQFIDTLTSLSKVVVFSAAIPNQGGQNHLNEQWPDYWAKKFEERGFLSFDILRPVLWNNPDVYVWYKQNIFLAIHKEHPLAAELNKTHKQGLSHNSVHPELFALKSEMLEKVLRGSFPFKSYIKLLGKSILRKVRR